MGRAPCCDKANVKKGPWSPEEDAKLKSYIEEHGTGGNWIALPQKIGLKRCGKSCRLRWLNYLRPNIKHGGFSEEEDNIICSLYISIGSRWSIIAAQLPGRTDNDIKNYWNTRLKKKLLGKQRKEAQQQARKGGSISSSTSRGQKQQQQEIIRRSGNSTSNTASTDHNILSTNNQNPYWPELPVLAPIPYSNQESRFNNHASIKNLLIKLGGKFSDDHAHHHEIHNVSNNPDQFPINYMSCTQQITYDDQPTNLQYCTAPSSSMMVSNDSTAAQFAQKQYEMLVQGQSSFAGGLEQMEHVVYSSQRLDGLEFLLADSVMNGRIEDPSSGSIINGCLLGEMSCHYPSTPPNCEEMQQQLLQEFGFDELRYSQSV